ncbi:MFS transporter [Bacillus pseudomycoides]|uniref:MFS transporter n=1 Tax=Bacillus pseudomycoides TaxID=64104 RepID=A0A2C3U1Q2_9BACI|nr:MFS transporter [Bacillus pseudomycoides]PEK23573.1 MFS transporter [Bacillus pseudomycoides]PEM71817.1 MFS transporter [Bacillus pseudomycoides]PEO07086.1 MFS transporter [Bacillus pseudomycoides]PEP59246.1 MFS transporter [Bacillus pseudomycoides]
MHNQTKTVPNSIKKGPIMFIMILGAFLATLNQTLMSVATPELMVEFKISATTAQWLTTGYMLVNGVLIPITAYLMQRFTTRELFQTSMFIFLAGTIVSAVATGFPVLLTGRMIQAAGAGVIMPLLTHVILTIFPREKRGAAMGMVGLAVIFAPAIGPTIAGYILENYKWETMFYGMIPFAVLVIVLGFIYLRNVSDRIKTKFNILSVILSTIGFGALIYGFSQAGSLGWSNIEVLSTIAVGILALALFSWKELRSQNPLLDLRVFKYNMFSLTTIINIAVTMVMYADMMLLPLYLQNMRGYTAIESGFLLLPGALVMGFLMPVTGKLFDRFGAKWLAIIGMTITIITTMGFINLTDSTSYTYLILMSTGRRIGMALMMMPIQTVGLNQLPQRLHAHGTAISNTIRQVAGAVGTSLLVTVMTDRTKSHLQDMIPTAAAKGLTQRELVTEASIQGINDAYLVIIGIGIIGLLLSFFIKKVKQASELESNNPAEMGTTEKLRTN